MLVHPVRRIAWGLAWRWSVLLASLVAPDLPSVTATVGLLLGVGIVASVWRRADFLGSAWRLLLAVAVIDLAFWFGGAFLIPAITLAVGISVGDLWWSLASSTLRPAPADEWAGVVAVQPRRGNEPRRRRATRWRTPAGL